MFEFCFASVWGSNIDNANIGHPDLLPVPLPMVLLTLPRTVLAFRYLWLSRFLRLKQSVPSLCTFVSLLSPLLALCLLFCLHALACSCCLAWFPLPIHHWMLLSFTVLKRMRKCVATKEFVRRLRGSISQNSSFGPRSDLVRTSFGPRLNCSQSKPSPERFWKGFAMVCCNGLLQ